MQLRLAFVLSILFINGCTATYVYPTSSIDDQLILKASGLNSIVLGLDETENTDYGGKGKPRPPGDLKSLYEEIAHRKIFKEINYIDNLKSKPDVILSQYRYNKTEFRGVHGEGGGVGCNIYLSALTLFIVPWYCSHDEDVIFKLSSARDQNCSVDVIIDRNAKNVMGWVAPLFRISPNWHAPTAEPQDSELQKRYSEYAVSKIIENTQKFVEVSKCK